MESALHPNYFSLAHTDVMKSPHDLPARSPKTTLARKSRKPAALSVARAKIQKTKQVIEDDQELVRAFGEK